MVVILHALLLVHYILNACRLLIFRYIKERTQLTGAISNWKCLFILTPQGKLDLQASRPQIYLLFNNLSTKRSSSSFLFPFIKAQVLMKNNWLLSAAPLPQAAVPLRYINTSSAPGSMGTWRNFMSDSFYISINEIANEFYKITPIAIRILKFPLTLAIKTAFFTVEQLICLLQRGFACHHELSQRCSRTPRSLEKWLRLSWVWVELLLFHTSTFLRRTPSHL